jgi:hypothetical protein
MFEHALQAPETATGEHGGFAGRGLGLGGIDGSGGNGLVDGIGAGNRQAARGADADGEDQISDGVKMDQTIRLQPA